MAVLLSIKPIFANRLFSGEKRYEFRKAIYGRRDSPTILVYVSVPVQKIIGELTVERVISDHPASIWKKTSAHAGIDVDLFFAYFQGREVGHAIKVASFARYKNEVVPSMIIPDFTPPQSYMYLSEALVSEIRQAGWGRGNDGKCAIPSSTINPWLLDKAVH